MSDHLKLSRITKALTDGANGSASFEEAEGRLSQVHVVTVLSPEQIETPAGQAAALTAVNTSFKCFGRTTVVMDPRVPLVRPLPLGDTIGPAAMALGAQVAASVPPDATHVIAIGNTDPSDTKAFVRCWWDGWKAGILPVWERRALGASGNPLSGVFSGALAVREVFATVLGYLRCGSRESWVSLWDPGIDPEKADAGPDTVYVSPRLWFIGLGHLGQGHLWSLGLLPIDAFEAVLQDDQDAGEENEATGLLTRGDFAKLRKKTRIAAAWLDRPGWTTRLIERRHHGDIPLLDGDPSTVITGLDDPDARKKVALAGFDYMIDAGVGHGPVDFEMLQIRVLEKGADPARFWSSHERPSDIEGLLMRPAYRSHAAGPDGCGTRTLASASVAVPFVGAAVGALTITQAIRLASMQSTIQMMQMELGTPAMAVVGAANNAPIESHGSVEVRLEKQ